jgi:hypothetical protein
MVVAEISPSAGPAKQGLEGLVLGLFRLVFRHGAPPYIGLDYLSSGCMIAPMTHLFGNLIFLFRDLVRTGP